MTIELIAGGDDYTDESGPLRAAICQAAGLPEAQAEEALHKLSSTNPQMLQGLLQQ